MVQSSLIAEVLQQVWKCPMWIRTIFKTKTHIYKIIMILLHWNS